MDRKTPETSASAPADTGQDICQLTPHRRLGWSGVAGRLPPHRVGPPHQAASGGNGARLWGRRSSSAVGYMDPGNWGTDLAGGAQFKYGPAVGVALASFMAAILQVISARLGVATGKDLAQCCREWYPHGPGGPTGSRWSSRSPQRFGRIAGQRGALNLLFHIPLGWAIIITAFDVLLLLALQGWA